MNKKITYWILTLLTLSLAACSGGTKGQLLSSIKKDKDAVVTNSITLTFPKNGTGNMLDFLLQSTTDQYIADHHLLLEKSTPPKGSLLQTMLADGYVTKQNYTVTENMQGYSRFTKAAGTGSSRVTIYQRAGKDVDVYFLTKKGEEYFSKDTSLFNAADAANNYLVKVKFYTEIPDHVVDYSAPSGSAGGQGAVLANVDFRVAKAAPNDIFSILQKIAEKSGQTVPKVGSYIKHQCGFTKMSDGYQVDGCQ